MFRPLTHPNQRLRTVFRNFVETRFGSCARYAQRVAALFTRCAGVQCAACEGDRSVPRLGAVQQREQVNEESKHVCRDILQLRIVENILRQPEPSAVIGRIFFPRQPSAHRPAHQRDHGRTAAATREFWIPGRFRDPHCYRRNLDGLL